MNDSGGFVQYPPDKERALAKALNVEWAAVGSMVLVVAMIGFTMGSSQAMRTLWIEDCLSLVPSISFIVGAAYRKRRPTRRFPYGYRRAVLIGYFAGAISLLAIGGFLLIDSIIALISGEHPTIASIILMGRTVWFGWIMMAALVVSIIPPIILSKLKEPLSIELNDKTLHTSATMDKGDYLSGAAAIAGIFGIALGWWWADAVAAAVISFEILKDGIENIGNAVTQLMKRHPTDITSKKDDPIAEQLEKKLRKLDWIEGVRVRLHEDGDLLAGEAFVKPRDERNLFEHLKQASALMHEYDWRIGDVWVIPVGRIEEAP